MLPLSTHLKLQNYRPRKVFKPSVKQRILIAYRSVVALLGDAFNKLNSLPQNENYDSYSDRSDDPGKWYRERYPIE